MDPIFENQVNGKKNTQVNFLISQNTFFMQYSSIFLIKSTRFFYKFYTLLKFETQVHAGHVPLMIYHWLQLIKIITFQTCLKYVKIKQTHSIKQCSEKNEDNKLYSEIEVSLKITYHFMGSSKKKYIKDQVVTKYLS